MLKHLKTPWTVRAILMATAALVFLRPAMAQAAATIEALTGQVSILQDANNLSSATALFIGNPVQPKQVVVTGPGSYARFHLADGSRFEVFENSKVQFREDYPAWAHLLNLILGHIRVIIDHSKGPNPNSVTTPTAVISVRGTDFDVAVEDDDGTTLVTLNEGWVHVRNQTAPGAEPDLRKPGDWVRVFRGQGLLGRQVNNNGILQKVVRPIEDALRVVAQQHPGGVIGGPSGAGGPSATGVPGAQGDKGKGGTAPAPPPPAPPSTTGH